MLNVDSPCPGLIPFSFIDLSVPLTDDPTEIRFGLLPLFLGALSSPSIPMIRSFHLHLPDLAAYDSNLGCLFRYSQAHGWML
jgi:hypothetical protein